MIHKILAVQKLLIKQKRSCTMVVLWNKPLLKDDPGWPQISTWPSNSSWIFHFPTSCNTKGKLCYPLFCFIVMFFGLPRESRTRLQFSTISGLIKVSKVDSGRSNFPRQGASTIWCMFVWPGKQPNQETTLHVCQPPGKHPSTIWEFKRKGWQEPGNYGNCGIFSQ